MKPVLKILKHRFEEQRAMASPPHVRAIPGTTALVLDSPHSGTHYPSDFAPACAHAQLRSEEDTHVERLFNFAPPMGAAWVEAFFARTYVDVNRDTTEIDVTMLDAPWPHAVATDPQQLAKIRLGKGLLWRNTDEGVAIYDRKLTVAEVQARIANCWQPYHQALEQAIDAAHARHGYCIHINCHSMPAVAAQQATAFPGLVHADFVIGDRDGTTASSELVNAIRGHLQGLGYSVEYNHPYKGVELIRRYSDPARQRHSIQLEINRKLYMNEQTRAIHDGFGAVQSSLRSLVELLLAMDMRAVR